MKPQWKLAKRKEKVKKSPLANVSVMKCSREIKKEVPVVMTLHIAIHRCPEALCFLHRPYQSLTPQLSVSQAETLNKHRIMARPQGIQKRE